MTFFRQMGQQQQDNEQARRLLTVSYDEVLRNKSIVGTPAQVVDRLCELNEQLGLDGLLAELNCGGEIPRPQVVRSFELLCERVMPRF
jgi:alkanesulfonate monooxygenase SsuD/methylene tetrahydromethanopterin reductase-like flavin-dependent oxidoreductase (luciferase family)